MDYDNLSGGGLDFFCTPLKIYLVVAVLSSIIYFAYKTLRGDGFPGISTLCSNIMCIILSSFLVAGLCVYNSILAWLFVIILSLCSVSGTYYYLTN
jgi:hypothetical protein